jgi:hypothetical protein
MTSAVAQATPAAAPSLSATLEFAGFYYATPEDDGSNSPSDRSRTVGNVVLGPRTTTVTASLGQKFGIAFRIHGPAAGTPVELRRVIRFPPGGLKDPSSPKPMTERAGEIHCLAESLCLYGWSMDDEWEVVPGPWHLEIYAGEQRIVSQRFDMLPRDAGSTLPKGVWGGVGDIITSAGPAKVTVPTSITYMNCAKELHIFSRGRDEPMERVTGSPMPLQVHSFGDMHVLYTYGRPMEDGPAWQQTIVWTLTQLSEDSLVLRYSRSINNPMLPMSDEQRHYGSSGTVELKRKVRCDED